MAKTISDCVAIDKDSINVLHQQQLQRVAIAAAAAAVVEDDKLEEKERDSVETLPPPPPSPPPLVSPSLLHDAPSKSIPRVAATTTTTTGASLVDAVDAMYLTTGDLFLDHHLFVEKSEFVEQLLSGSETNKFGDVVKSLVEMVDFCLINDQCSAARNSDPLMRNANARDGDNDGSLSSHTSKDHVAYDDSKLNNGSGDTLLLLNGNYFVYQTIPSVIYAITGNTYVPSILQSKGEHLSDSFS